MNISIRPATPSDASALAALNIKAFQSQPFYQNTFPNLSFDAVHALKHARYLRKIADPRNRVLVAVDTDSGAVVGGARWVFPASLGEVSGNEYECEKEGEGDMETGKDLPAGTRREVYEGFFNTIQEKKKVYLRGDDIVLEYLATIPEAQGQGVGKALLRWGMDEADRHRRRIYLEATTAGFPVYRKNGWEALEEVTMEYARWGGEGTQTLVLMMRDPAPAS